ncbi:hypothetical protein BDW62DRAFT_83061 [Aspergillus aurantiobrunneus]
MRQNKVERIHGSSLKVFFCAVLRCFSSFFPPSLCMLIDFRVRALSLKLSLKRPCRRIRGDFFGITMHPNAGTKSNKYSP